MKGKQPLTLAEMAAQSARTGGRLVCPKCNCVDFRTDKTTRGYVSTFRRKVCRNCGRAIETVQPPEQFVREIEPRENLNDLDSGEHNVDIV